MSKPDIEIKITPPKGSVDDPAWDSEALTQEDQDRKAERDQVLDPAESMKSRPDTKNLTIGEIKQRDEDNLRLLLKGRPEWSFNTSGEAMAFIEDCISACLLKLGITAVRYKAPPVPTYNGGTTEITGNLFIPEEVRMNIVEQQMIDNDVRREIRFPEQYPDPIDQWKVGCYYYHGSEIAYFISLPLQDRRAVSGGGHIIITHASPQKFIVLTNAPV